MSTQPQILILGAAGYIGGTVLTDLLSTHPASTITALVRTPDKSSLLSPLGVNTVIGELDNLDLLTSLVSASDAVLNFAVPFGGGDAAIQAIVDALEARALHSSIKPVLLQTSGTGTVLYGSGGIAGTDVWSDEDYSRWSALPNEAYFHSGNRIVAAAAGRDKIGAYIIMSPTVYGKGAGPGNKLSLQIPAYVRYAKRTGRAAYVGRGENIWGNVHVADLSRFYLSMLHHAYKNPTQTKAVEGSGGWGNLLYTGTGQHTWGPLITTLGDLLFARGDVKEAGASQIEDGAADMFMFGGNSFLKLSEKSKALGLVQKELDIDASMREALPSPAQQRATDSAAETPVAVVAKGAEKSKFAGVNKFLKRIF